MKNKDAQIGMASGSLRQSENVGLTLVLGSSYQIIL